MQLTHVKPLTLRSMHVYTYLLLCGHMGKLDYRHEVDQFKFKGI
jgi:hypothetical protein